MADDPTNPTNSPYYAGPYEAGAGLESSSSSSASKAANEESEATKSACVIVFLIFIVLALIGTGTWYYLSRDRDQKTEQNGQKEEVKRDPNLIAAREGGKVIFSGFEIIIPPGALPQDTKIEIEKAAYGAITDRYRVKPDGLKFLKPVTLVIPYKESGLREGETPYDIRLGYWFENEWNKQFLNYAVDSEAKKLRTQVIEL